ncbi:MAG: MFS transporter [Marinilabiliaceae bacterium]|nr:MFS transporter [Marinilabiliaceae bacterium]
MMVLIFPVVVMLALGGLYAWSMFVPSLQMVYGITPSQTQWIFGMVIASFTLSMILADRIERRLGLRRIVALAGILFAAGYLLAWLSEGRFSLIFLGIGLVSGIGTGLGYMASLAMAVRRFPHRKGLVSGIVSAGFGGGAVVLTYFSEGLLDAGNDVLIVFRLIGLIYGAAILLVSFLMPHVDMVPASQSSVSTAHIKRLALLFVGILMGTFAGLMVIGNLKLIGASDYSSHQLSIAIVVFAISNFSGRLLWGWICDHVSNVWLMSTALVMQGMATFAIGHWSFGVMQFYVMVMFVGLGFAANFVLFAKEVAHRMGPDKFGKYYPYVFLGYGLAGVAGPVIGAMMFEHVGNFQSASLVAFVIAVIGIVVFYRAAKVPLSQS